MSDFSKDSPVSTKYPGWRWDPSTGESRVIVTAEDLPDGWLDHHPAHDGPVAAAPAHDDTPAPAIMTRDEITAALTAGGVTFHQSVSTSKLYAKLCEALRNVLTGRNIAFAPDADGRALLALVTKE